MKRLDVKETILIVVGASLNAEEKDRPLAYMLKSQIDKSKRAEGHPFRKTIVISDLLYLQDKIIPICPTIAIGGPGVNAVTASLADKLPLFRNRDNRYFIQLDEEFGDKRISIWGVNALATKEGIQDFIESGLLEKFLNSVWK